MAAYYTFDPTLNTISKNIFYNFLKFYCSTASRGIQFKLDYSYALRDLILRYIKYITIQIITRYHLLKTSLACIQCVEYLFKDSLKPKN